MLITVFRYLQDDDNTVGVLQINNQFQCYTLENSNKLFSGGHYSLKLRTTGRLHGIYKQKFPDFHAGMIEITGVPSRFALLFHIANYWHDLEGCIGVGKDVLHSEHNDYFKMLLGSSDAYATMYQKVAKALTDGEDVSLLIGNSFELVKYEFGG